MFGCFTYDGEEENDQTHHSLSKKVVEHSIMNIPAPVTKLSRRRGRSVRLIATHCNSVSLVNDDGAESKSNENTKLEYVCGQLACVSKISSSSLIMTYCIAGNLQGVKLLWFTV